MTIYDIFNPIINFILYPQFTGWLLDIKIIFLLFSAFFLGFVIWALTNTSWLRKAFLQDMHEFIDYKPYGLKKLDQEWKMIKARLATGAESEFKLAMIEADMLLNDTLKQAGYAGDSLGERLDKLTVDILPELDQIRQAHKTCSDIIHDPTFKLTEEETKKDLAIYESVLIDLGAL